MMVMVNVNGIKKKSNYRLKGGEHIEILIPKTGEMEIKAEDIDMIIIER